MLCVDFLRCQVHWQKQRRTLNSPENLLVKVDGKLTVDLNQFKVACSLKSVYFLLFLAADRLDLNITTSLIAMIQNTLKNWSEDYYGPAFLDSSPSKRDPVSQKEAAPSESSTAEVVTAGHFRKRAPFVPFLLRNQTGIVNLQLFRQKLQKYFHNSPQKFQVNVQYLLFFSGCSLHFATVTSSPSKVVMTTTGLVFSGRVHTSNISDSSKKLSEWRELLPGGEVPFEFKQSREKQRHKVRSLFRTTIDEVERGAE